MPSKALFTLSYEWVVPSRPTGENTSPANNSMSVTSMVSINDVLCGRGVLTNHHPGNVFFHKLVCLNQKSYLLVTKRDKAGVAKGIVNTIRSLKPPERFLKKARDINANGIWVEIGDRRAREKTVKRFKNGPLNFGKNYESGGNNILFVRTRKPFLHRKMP